MGRPGSFRLFSPGRPTSIEGDAVEQKRVPARRVYADDFSLTLDGIEYHPHAGEWVEYRPVGSVGAYLDLLRSRAVKVVPEDEDEAEATAAYVERAREEVRRRVVAWDWTDITTGEPLPPPREGGIECLSLAEMLWLQGALYGRGESDPKAGAATSTSRSRGKAARTLKAG